MVPNCKSHFLKKFVMLFIFTYNTAIRSSCLFSLLYYGHIVQFASPLVPSTSPCHIPCASVYRISFRSGGLRSWGIGLSDGTKYYQLLSKGGCMNMNSLQQYLEVAILLTPTQTPGKK